MWGEDCATCRGSSVHDECRECNHARGRNALVVMSSRLRQHRRQLAEGVRLPSSRWGSYWVLRGMMFPEQCALHQAMRDMSQDGWLAGWVVGLEYLAWEVALGTRRECEFLEPHELESHRVQLRALSEACGGWIVWPAKDRWPRWVPMAEWLAMYRDHVPHT